MERRSEAGKEPRYKAEAKRILTLLNKAIVSTSLKDKNDVLNEVRKVWEPQNSNFESLQKVLAIKTDELASLRSQLSSDITSLDTLRTNTSFVERLDILQQRHPKETLVSTVRELEADISKHHPVQFPEKLDDALAIKDEGIQLFNLRDLSLHRLEQLAYAFRKRLLVVEQSQDSTEDVVREFGSINDLIDQMHILEAENEELRNEEKRYIHSAITRRRKFATLTPHCARELAIVYRNLLAGERTVLHEMDNMGYENASLDIDAVMKDQGFSVGSTEFDTQEFVNMTEPDMIDVIVENENLAEKVKAFERLIDTTEAQVTKVLSEIQTSKDNYVRPPEGSRTRMGKLMESNEILLDKVAVINRTIDDQQKDVTEQARELCQMIREKEQVEVELIHRLYKMRDLAASHVLIMNRAFLNRDVVSNLYHLVSAMGNGLLNPGTETDLAEYLERRFTSLTARMQAEEIARRRAEALKNAAPPEEETREPEPLTPLELQQKLMQRKRKKSVRQRRTSVKSQKVNPEDMHIDIEPAKQLEAAAYAEMFFASTRPRLEVLHGLATASEIAGYLKGVDKPFRQKIDRMMAPCVETLQKEMKAVIQSFEGKSTTDLNQVNMLANGILVKEKENISVQTEAVVRGNISSQTVEMSPAKPPPKPKGKK